MDENGKEGEKGQFILRKETRTVSVALNREFNQRRFSRAAHVNQKLNFLTLRPCFFLYKSKDI